MSNLKKFISKLSDEDKSHLMDLLHESMETEEEEKEEHEEDEDKDDKRPNFKRFMSKQGEEK
jgi:hypothetical protein